MAWYEDNKKDIGFLISSSVYYAPNDTASGNQPVHVVFMH